jgi:hypothetical protein
MGASRTEPTSEPEACPGQGGPDEGGASPQGRKDGLFLGGMVLVNEAFQPAGLGEELRLGMDAAEKVE